jgi:hypothetical protein
MVKRGNPLFKATSPEVEVLDPDSDGIVPLNESFPGMPPMSVREKKRLAELEEVVTTNFKAFYEVGCALREICESKLYRETHKTFADYANDLWDMARCRAYQIIEAADIVDRLIPHVPELKMSTNGRQNGSVSHGRQIQKSLPQNERQARALAKYPEDKQIEIWRQAVETSDDRITAAHIKRTARQMHGKVVKENIKKARKRASQPSVKMSDRMRAAFEELFDAVNEDRLADWKHTDPNELLRYLRGLMEAIAHPL